MMRKALLLLLFRQLSIAAVIKPRKPAEDVDNFNDLKSKMITEMMMKELSVHKCRLHFAGANLSELYFHLARTDITVHIQNPFMLPPTCAIIENIETNIFDSRMDLSLTFPSVTVKGNVMFRQKTVRMNRFKEKYPFGFILSNVTSSGLCFTRWTQIGYEIIDCDLKYKKFSIYRIKISGIQLPLDENVFFESSIEKMWIGLTNVMNGNIVKSFNDFLYDMNIVKFLRNETIFEKYQDYIVESTERANEFIDGIIEAVRKIIIERFHDSFVIPNIEEGFQRKGILVIWQGSFKADHGTVRGLSTVSRIGDTVFATDKSSQTHFFGNLSFDRLDLHYDRYKAEFMNFGPTGTLNTRLYPIKLFIHPYVNFETGKIYLEEFKIEDVGELVVDVTGLGTILSWIISKIVTWVVGLTRDKILNDLQKKYDEYIRTILSGYTIEEITNGKFFGGS